MATVIPFPGVSPDFVSAMSDNGPAPDVVLEAAKGLDQIIIIGTTQDGDLYVAGSVTAAMAVYLIEQAKLFILTDDD